MTPREYRLLILAAQWRGIARALIEAKGNRMHAARKLGITRTYLLRILQKVKLP